MTDDDERRRRILEVAADLFVERGYGGTRLRMVAKRAGVTPRTVRALTGSRAQLFAEVLASAPPSESATRVAAAAADPNAAPPVSVLIEAAGDAFATPERSWNVVELEALTRSHSDDEVRALETARLKARKANLKLVTEQTRRAGGIDDRIDDDAFVRFYQYKAFARHGSRATLSALRRALRAEPQPLLEEFLKDILSGEGLVVRGGRKASAETNGTTTSP